MKKLLLILAFLLIAANAYAIPPLPSVGGVTITGGLNPLGAYDNAHTYAKGDNVTDNSTGCNYTALGATTGHTPPNGLYWTVGWGCTSTVAGPTGSTGATGSQGPKGDTGSAGAQGAQGPQGTAGATGSQGPAGSNGTGFTYRGAYSGKPGSPSSGDTMLFTDGTTAGVCTAGNFGSGSVYVECSWNGSSFVALGGSGNDSLAFHTTTSSEISGLTHKASPVAGDFFLLEDSASGNSKKYSLLSDISTALGLPSCTPGSGNCGITLTRNTTSFVCAAGTSGGTVEVASDGTLHYCYNGVDAAVGAGTGTVTVSGSPSNYDWAYWTSGTNLTNKTMTASKPACTDTNGAPAVCGGSEYSAIDLTAKSYSTPQTVNPDYTQYRPGSGATNPTYYRGFLGPAQPVTGAESYQLPNAQVASNSMWIFGADAAGVSAITLQTLSADVINIFGAANNAAIKTLLGYPTSGDYATPAQTFYFGTTQIAINRSSAALSLAGVSFDNAAAQFYDTSAPTKLVKIDPSNQTAGHTGIIQAPDNGTATLVTGTELTTASTLGSWTSGAGTVGSGDTYLAALQKIDGNVGTKAPSSSPTLTTASITPQTIDCHANCSPTAAQSSNAIFSNYAQSPTSSGSSAVTGPTVAAGMNFVLIQGTALTSSATYVYNSTTNNIYLDTSGTPVTTLTLTAQGVGSSVSCFSFQTGSSVYSLKCTTLSGTAVGS